jgi:hypothetical protein
MMSPQALHFVYSLPLLGELSALRAVGLAL